ncbi:NUDIX hydrolase domain-like protein [Cercophora newfieldiana]|uniref:NUDIX hydrolase domain-like protein n=1 Tax=Cercophora newfieldiana TaxID=92897 RepID=A0AA39XUU6_9PEZI|nr:NUDIX hydrolase domain-like protein [Cercophora newfieldiana]
MTTAQLPPFTHTHANPDLAPFDVSLETYLASNPTISRLVTSAVVVRCPTSGTAPRVLLIQRAASDGFPLQWECPGGSVDVSDQTILHALHRELFEETGLALTRIVDLLNGGVEFRWGDGICRKLTFMVEVEERAGGVVLNPEEHVDFVWASEEDVRAEVCGGREVRFAYETLRDAILEGLRRAKERGVGEVVGGMHQQKSV